MKRRLYLLAAVAAVMALATASMVYTQTVDQATRNGLKNL